MRQRGVIIGKQDRQAIVQVQDPASTCGACKGCVRLTKERAADDFVVQVQDAGDQYEVGDEVILETRTSDLAKALAILYGVPFIALFCGYGLTRLITTSDPASGLGAVVGLLVGALVARLTARRLFRQDPELSIVARACS